MRWSRVALALASAGLLFLAGEPLGIGILGWVALVPLFVAVYAEERRGWAWLYGFVFAFAYFGAHLEWIFLFGWMAWTALTFVLACYTSLATLVGSIVRRSGPSAALVAGAFVGTELGRDRWPVGGFPWGAVGTTQGAVWGVRWLAGTVGVYGLSFLCAFASAALAGLVVRRRLDVRSLVLVGAVLAVFMILDASLFASPPPGRPLHVAVVQGGVPRPVRPDQRDVILASHLRITRRLEREHGPLDLVVWPEDSIGIGVSPGAIEKVENLARELRTPFLIGHSIADDATRSFVNRVQYIDAQGRLVEQYQKRHPVPFGERVPIEFFRRFVSTLNAEIPYDQAPGRRITVFEVGGVHVATPICFESVFPRDFLDFARRGAELFVLSTNNASFEHSYAAQQHIAHTRMRALELRQWVIQDALAGISGVISPDGGIAHRTRLFEATGFVADVRARPPRSLYSRTGDVFAEMWAAAAAAAALWSLTLKRVALPSWA